MSQQKIQAPRFDDVREESDRLYIMFGPEGPDTMYVRDALKVFGSRAAIARALGGSRHRSAVYQWTDLVPIGAAFTLASAAPPGTLTMNPAIYEDRLKKRKRTLKRNLKKQH